MTASTLEKEPMTNNHNLYFKKQAISRLGETRINSLGSVMWIAKYENYGDIWVQFLDGYTTHTSYDHFCRGNVRNPNDASVYGRGKIGVGKHLTSLNGKHTFLYSVWFSMLSRCYSPSFKAKHPTYKDCVCSNEWLNFQSFADWYCKNDYYSDEVLQLDKDILHKGNKLYSADNCILVPQSINNLFVKRDLDRGKHPVGVQQRNGKYRASCSVGLRAIVQIGTFNTEKEAFNAYKIFKEQRIKDVADKYQAIIPEKLYRALYGYEVSIDD